MVFIEAMRIEITKMHSSIRGGNAPLKPKEEEEKDDKNGKDFSALQVQAVAHVTVSNP